MSIPRKTTEANRIEAKAIEWSENSKLGGMSTTYAAKGSCPKDCAFLKSGACYGECGPIKWQWDKLEGVSAASIATAEAAAIDGLSARLDLRVHSLGDCRTDKAAKIVSGAAERYMKRGRRLAFTFTHGWRKVARSSWGKLSTIASCERPADVKLAQDAGYATALVVPAFEKDTAYVYKGVKILPCPEQTGRCASCADCRLCMQDGKLKAVGLTIAFKPHGPSLKAKAMLEKINA